MELFFLNELPATPLLRTADPRVHFPWSWSCCCHKHTIPTGASTCYRHHGPLYTHIQDQPLYKEMGRMLPVWLRFCLLPEMYWVHRRNASMITHLYTQKCSPPSMLCRGSRLRLSLPRRQWTWARLQEPEKIQRIHRNQSKDEGIKDKRNYARHTPFWGRWSLIKRNMALSGGSLIRFRITNLPQINKLRTVHRRTPRARLSQK